VPTVLAITPNQHFSVVVFYATAEPAMREEAE
jgi:hypothetical protein